MIFARKLLKFYVIIALKNFSRMLGGTCPPHPPVSYAHGFGQQMLTAPTVGASEVMYGAVATSSMILMMIIRRHTATMTSCASRDTVVGRGNAELFG